MSGIQRQHKTKDARTLAQMLEGMGRNGDTILAHINPAEAAMLKRMGGAGTINPKTGLREYGPVQGGRGGGQAGGRDGLGGGGSGGGGGGERDRLADAYRQYGGSMRAAGMSNLSGAPGSNNPGARDRNGRLKDAYRQYGDTMTQAGMANLAGPPGYNGAIHDFNNRSIGWDVLDFLAGPFVNVNRPSTTIPGSYSGGTFHTSTNIPGSIGSIAGMGLGIPGLGLLGSYAGDALGVPEAYHGSSDDGTALNSPGNKTHDASASWGGNTEMSGGGNYQGLLGFSKTPPKTSQPGLLGLAPSAPKPSPWAEQFAKRHWKPVTMSIPGPSPYTYQSAQWV